MGSMRFRPIQEEDLPLLNALAGERPLNLAQVRFFARTHHSFLAEEEAPMGFALAQAIWQGDRASLFIARVEGRSLEALRGLLRAVVKSAQDAGIHEVFFHLNPARTELKEALFLERFHLGACVVAVFRS